MARPQALAALLLCTGVALAAQQRAPDGVPVNDQGEPQYSTFSLCAVDPQTGQSGAAVTTRVPFVGRAVPHVRAGVGAVCTQASTMVEYGPRGLDLLAKGIAPQDVLQQLLANDAQRESRQVGLIDMKGQSRRAHRQTERELGGQQTGAELHRAGEHHGRPGGDRGRGGELRRDRTPAGHWRSE